MAIEDIKAALAVLTDELTKRPEDRGVLQAQIQEKLGEIRALGLAIPAEYLQFDDDPAEDDGDDFFDNMPV